jgi:hypothetical protein
MGKQWLLEITHYYGAGENPSFCITFHIYNIKKWQWFSLP